MPVVRTTSLCACLHSPSVVPR